MKTNALVLALAVLAPLSARAAISFDFENAPQFRPLPLDVTSDGLTAHLSGTGDNYSIQTSNCQGLNIAGFSGLCIYPSGVYGGDLLISFSQPLTDFSIMYATEEYGSDTTAQMKVTAYTDSTLVGFNTNIAPNPGTWPTGTLTFSSLTTFNNVVVHYNHIPIGGENYGPVFMADNMLVTAAIPEPATLGLLGLGLGAILLRRGWRPSAAPTSHALQGAFSMRNCTGTSYRSPGI